MTRWSRKKTRTCCQRLYTMNLPFLHGLSINHYFEIYLYHLSLINGKIPERHCKLGLMMLRYSSDFSGKWFIADQVLEIVKKKWAGGDWAIPWFSRSHLPLRRSSHMKASECHRLLKGSRRSDLIKDLVPDMESDLKSRKSFWMLDLPWPSTLDPVLLDHFLTPFKRGSSQRSKKKMWKNFQIQKSEKNLQDH